MKPKEAFEILRDTPIDIRSAREDDIHSLYATAQNMALDALERQMWIPVSEREPKEPEDGFKRYIVQRASNAEPRSLYWDQYGTWLDEEGTPYTDIIAWMPLPPAFKEGEDGDN